MIEAARELAIRLATHASDVINERFEHVVEVHRKEGGSIVTDTDVELNQHTMDAIASRFPQHGFIGEELGSHNANEEFVWVCDPIDGTRPFTLGFPVSTYALALLQHGQPVLSVVAYPARNWMFVAEAGSGATLNGVPLNVSTSPTIPRGVIDFQCTRSLRYRIPRIYDAIEERGGKAVSYGSVVLMAVSVARGALLGSVFSGEHPWDAAASKLVVTEAGGRFTDIYGSEQTYNTSIRGYVASNGVVHEQLLEIIQSCGIVDTQSAC